MPPPNCRRRPLLAAVGSCAAFLLALGAVCLAINSRLPSLRVAEIAAKLDYLSAHRGDFDTVLVGSSRVFHGIDAPLFDRALAAHGRPARTFNLGIDGMRPPESFYVVRELLKRRLPLRRLLLELGDLQPKVNAANIGSARYVHWHDLRHTWLIVRQIATARRPRGERLFQAVVHAGCFAARVSNLGRGHEWLGARLAPVANRPAPTAAWQARAGFVPLTTPAVRGAARADFEAAVVTIRERGLAKTPLSPLLAEALRELLGEVRAAGVAPALIITPTIVGRENLVPGPGAEPGAPIFAFPDPATHPALFLADHHCDLEHLTAAGAQAYTEALAAAFAASQSE